MLSTEQTMGLRFRGLPLLGSLNQWSWIILHLHRWCRNLLLSLVPKNDGFVVANSLVQKMTKFCCRRTRWREAHLTILETAALWNDYKASRRQQVEWLHPEWRFLLNAEFDCGSLLISCRLAFHEAFHLLVVETFDKVGMTVQDADSQECIPMFDETREQT